MTSTLKKTSRFRWKKRAIIPELLLDLFIIPMMIIIIGMFGLIIKLSFDLHQLLGVALAIVFGSFGVLFFLMLVLLACAPFCRYKFNYLEVSKYGLEYRYWPSYHIKCSWGDLEKLSKYSMFFASYDMLHLTKAERFSNSFLTAFYNFSRLSTKKTITISGFEGWPKGELENILKEHAPQLFEKEDKLVVKK